jgi:hypothetical protein
MSCFDSFDAGARTCQMVWMCSRRLKMQQSQAKSNPPRIAIQLPRQDPALSWIKTFYMGGLALTTRVHHGTGG